MRAMVRRRAVIAGAIAWPLFPFTARAQGDDLAKARAEGELTWYVSQMDGPTAEGVGRAFRDKTGVKVNVIRITTQVGYQRVRQELRSQAMICDVLSTTDIGQYLTLKKQNELAAITPLGVAALRPDFRSFNASGAYYPTFAGEVILARNTNAVPEAIAPKTWTDLLNPRWKGKITVGHPAFSGYSGNWTVLMLKAHGRQFLEALAKQDPLVSRSIIDTVTMLNSGERMVGVSPSASVIDSKARGNPVEIIYPEDGAVLMIAPSAVLAKAPHPSAARAFFDFMFTPEYTGLVVKSGSISLRPDVPPAPGSLSLDQVKTIQATEQQAVVDLPKAIEEWRDIFGN